MCRKTMKHGYKFKQLYFKDNVKSVLKDKDKKGAIEEDLETYSERLEKHKDKIFLHNYCCKMNKEIGDLFLIKKDITGKGSKEARIKENKRIEELIDIL